MDTSTIDRLVHRATERLASVPEGGARAEQLEALRRFLRLETERLRMRHRVGLGGDEMAAGRSQQVDLAVRRISQLAAAELALEAQEDLSSVALVALGGYGRADLAPYSDVDLLYLHDGRGREVVRQFVELTLALLWDTGFTVGHSFRTIDECVAIAREDLHSRTAMAEARFVTGNEPLFVQFQERLDEAVFRNRRDTEPFVRALRVETEARLEKQGRSVGLLEPNVKEGAGGLRDLHTILWLGHARLGTRRLEDLRDGGHLSEVDYAALRRARAFLTRVRNEAHFVTGRKTDLLTLDVQPALAANLGYVAWRGLAPSERLMRDYYQRAHELHHVFEGFAVRQGLHDRPRPFRLRLPLRRRHPLFEAHDGALHLRPGRGGEGLEPLAMLEAFDLAQEQGVTLSEGVRVAIRSGLRAVDGRFRAGREARRVFLSIVGRRGRVATALRAMHDTGFLGRYLPELARITFLVQHDHYHRYTVDEHTLRTLEALDEVALTRDRQGPLAPFRKALDEITDVTPLYLGLLLHDIGKGRAESHVSAGVRIAQGVCARLKLERHQAEEVVFLVRCHLTMSQLSQRRDLSEEGLVREFAEKVGGLERLNALLLLTYADHRGVGPGIWNAWKASLLWELYDRARSVLTGRPARTEGDWRVRTRTRTLEALAGRFAPARSSGTWPCCRSGTGAPWRPRRSASTSRSPGDSANDRWSSCGRARKTPCTRP